MAQHPQTVEPTAEQTYILKREEETNAVPSLWWNCAAMVLNDGCEYLGASRDGVPEVVERPISDILSQSGH